MLKHKTVINQSYSGQSGSWNEKERGMEKKIKDREKGRGIKMRRDEKRKREKIEEEK